MRDTRNPHEPPPPPPPITPPRLLAIAAGIAAFPAILYAIEHPTAAAAALLSFGVVATAVRVA
ncbi:hypothetical protein SAMN05216559_3963 [Halomicrobium zhouii]|uniref:Uncharacterized protein n=1 Tax=Halomicrobium zhouii TaxID=767519 RepID=A0A1I6M870_9EURY|nr:hypothetical protein [Halomicrobium zhouii]SFS11871.1 hypothetical protein SAMN05216559_3963 [Halomicrobium zhouii]